MSTKNINKVIYGGETLIDLSGITAHDKSGVLITGECTFGVDSSDATAAVAEILEEKTAYARGTVLTGTMPNNGAVTETITAKEQAVLPDEGYNRLSQVTLLPIPYTESENSTGDTTVTIAG